METRSPFARFAQLALALCLASASVAHAQSTVVSAEPVALAPIRYVVQESPNDAVPADPNRNPNQTPAYPASPAPVGAELLGITKIGGVSTNIAPPKDPKGRMSLPKDIAQNIVPSEPVLSPSFVTLDEGFRTCLAPAHFCHQPLYFEEVQLERYGQTRIRLVQPVVSGVKFGVNCLTLPYQMVVNRPRACQHHAYPYQTGGAAPHYFVSPTFNRRAALVEAATIAGFILVLP